MGWQVIKLQGWEERFLQGVEDARSVELHWLSKYVYHTAINIFVLWLAPVAACVAIFAACIRLGVPITPALAFTTIATVRILQEPMRVFPQAVIAVTQVHTHTNIHHSYYLKFSAFNCNRFSESLDVSFPGHGFIKTLG